jgi:hypothetical protein
MGEPTETGTATKLPPVPPGERLKRWRATALKGRGVLQVWLPRELLDRVRAVRKQQRRTLIAFVEMALEERVELAERFGAASAVGAPRPVARKRRAG